ncbi:hypothetical protein [Fredinandcohnia sp. 179-A 10B2 NHS]|uniref:hypothetical protein n=1 Tax=Fredinandcohnia sp. 179-A 10B2 NHS TaxID=3235176 RepID=UPI0039A0DFA0
MDIVDIVDIVDRQVEFTWIFYVSEAIFVVGKILCPPEVDSCLFVVPDTIGDYLNNVDKCMLMES